MRLSLCLFFSVEKMTMVKRGELMALMSGSAAAVKRFFVTARHTPLDTP